MARAERRREAVASMPYGVTVSVGVAAMPVENIEWTAAAAAMYGAKRAGGNQARYRDCVR
jgi:GGDEF domain-containing protein